MRKFTGIRSSFRILVLLLTLFSFTSGGLVMARSGAAGGEPPRLDGDALLLGGPSIASMQVDASSLSAVELTARIGQLQVEKSALFDNPYLTLTGEGLGHGSQTGLPDLPVLRRDVEIPYGARYSLEVISSQYTEVKLADLGLPAQILPLQPSQPKCGSPVEPCQQDASVYGQDAFFPANPLAVAGEYQVRGHRALTIEAWPVAYNPVQGTLRLYSDLRFRIRLSGSDAIQTLSQSARLASPAFEQTLSTTLLNYNLNQGARLQANLNAVHYLIIVADAYQAGIADFVALKQAQGFTVTVANTSTTGTTKEAIKTYITNQYTGATPPSYVLFVGDTNTIPNWPFKSSGQTSFLTDLYHVTMDGTNDYVPDIYRGRFPVRDAAQLANMVNNNLWYANEVTGAEAWVKKISYLATGTDGEWALVEATHNYCVETHTQPAGYTGIFPSNPQPGGDKLYAKTYSANGTNVINSLNDGRAMTIYSGHGSTTSWANPPVSQATVRSLTGNPIPYVVGHACVTADFNVAEAFSDTWVIQEGKGALVYVGASDNSYWDEDDILQREIFDALYDGALESPSIAQALYAGLAGVQTIYSGSAQYYWEEYNLFGDPSLVIVTEPRSADFTLDASPDRLEICGAAAATSTISVGSLNEFNTPVDLSLSGAPSGVTSGFAPATVTPAGQSALTLTHDGSTAAGVYPLTIHGAAGTLTHTTQLDLGIFSAAPGAPTLLTPADGALNQPNMPTFTWSAVDQSNTYTLQVATDAEFNSLVINQAGLTATSYTPGTALNTNTQYYWRVIANNTCGSANSAVFSFFTLPAPGDCGAGTVPQTLFFSDLESGLSGWADASTGSYHWATSTLNFYSPTHSALGVDVSVVSDQRLVSPAFTLPTADLQPITFSFWHSHAFEFSSSNCWDGGVLELSADGGSTWTQLTPLAGTYGYNGTVASNYSNPLGGKQAWCFNSNTWQRTVADLSAYAGQSIQLRLRLGSDSSVGSTGWNVDDLRVQSCRPDYAYPILFPTFWK